VLLEEGPALMAGMQDAIGRQDASALRRAAHTLKSSANVFAAKPVAAAAWRLETLGRAGTLAGAAEAWVALETAVAQLLPASAGHFPCHLPVPPVPVTVWVGQLPCCSRRFWLPREAR
jgi:HPt (histidine-containing phosphotransfer) domain-containing protein